MWCIADLTPEYFARMADVLALYERPYNPREPVVCFVEKPVALHAEARPPRPARAGHAAKRDNEYRRCGTASIFGIVEPKAGRHLSRMTPTRSGAEFAHAIDALVAAYPRAHTIHLVLDNLNIHHEGALVAVFGARVARRLWRRLTIHYTPKHGSWLNQAEIELSLLALHPQSRAPQIPVQSQHIQTVKDLEGQHSSLASTPLARIGCGRSSGWREVAGDVSRGPSPASQSVTRRRPRAFQPTGCRECRGRPIGSCRPATPTLAKRPS